MKLTSSGAVDVSLIVAFLVMILAMICAWAYTDSVAVAPPSSDLDRLTALSTATAAIGSIFAFVVLAAYTRETYLLRTAAERQLEASVRPLLILEMSSLPRDPAQPVVMAPILVRNIGSGPAFDIQIAPVIGIDDVQLEFQLTSTTYLEAGRHVEILPLYSEGGQFSGYSEKLSQLMSKICTGCFSNNPIAAICYRSMSGASYRSSHRIVYHSESKVLKTEMMSSPL